MRDWTVDMIARSVKHASGLTIVFEGTPGSDHFIGAPRNYSKAMNPLELSRLIREGFAEYESALLLAAPSSPAQLNAV